MSGTYTGVERTAAKRIGCTLVEYRLHRASGEHWCGACSTWKHFLDFNCDQRRPSGAKNWCRDCQNRRAREKYECKIRRPKHALSR